MILYKPLHLGELIKGFTKPRRDRNFHCLARVIHGGNDLSRYPRHVLEDAARAIELMLDDVKVELRKERLEREIRAVKRAILRLEKLTSV